ncbi:hypothetical protein [Glycomyces salinus]|uniref:hypothetical protein n=1 Tax=Glycomyces salinus TaxID=980294 RepID=UPI0018EB51BC|nr:hypothetical protein [Glycomyces salinus]
MDEDEETLQARWPLPDWVADSKLKQTAAIGVANAIGGVLENWPRFDGDQVQREYAEHTAAAVRDSLAPYRSDELADPSGVLVDYVYQLALIEPGDVQDVDNYRELLRRYARYLLRLAQDSRE